MTPLGIRHRAQINRVKSTWGIGVLGILLLVRLCIGSEWYLAVLGEVIVLEENTGSSPNNLKICDQQALPLQRVYYYWPPLSGRTSAI